MNSKKEIYITGFALFSLFFGAGNLLLPPLLGYNAGDGWYWVTLGFMITAVVIPIFGILAHAKLQGTMYDFGKKVSPIFSVVYCVIVYLISITIPSPRTAAATHEIAIFPNFESSALFTSSIYFTLVLVFVLNRSKILNLREIPYSANCTYLNFCYRYWVVFESCGCGCFSFVNSNC